jgi:integrase
VAHVAAATSPSQASTTAISANTFGNLGGGGTIKIAVEAVFAQLVDEAVGARLDATTLNRLWATLAETGRKPRSIDGAPSGLSSKSIENVAMTVHRMLKDAVRWGRLARNPADAADPPRRSVQTRQVQAWDAETLRRFLSRCRTADDPLYSLWVFLATTGLRRGEALGLDWADVDLAAARVRITHTLGSIRWNLVAGQPKTSAGRRPIALDPLTVSVLRDHRRRMLEQRLLVGAGFVDQDYVFCEPDSSPLHPERVYHAFKRRVRKYQMPYLSPHGLRHTWATIALANGVHPRVVQEHLGHAHISITLQTYSHVQPTMHDDAAVLVANLVLPEG